MSDQTLGIPVRDLEAARKRAYALKDKANDLGHQVALAHTYELLGAAWGYKNWATVKSLLAKPSVDHVFQIGVVDEELDDNAVRLPLADCMNHVEIISEAERYATHDFVLATVSSVIKTGCGMFFAFTGAQKECIDEVLSAAAAAGRGDDIRIINLNPLHRDRKGWNVDIYGLLDREGLASLLFESMLGDFGKGDRLYSHRLRSARSLTSALAGLAEWTNEERGRLSARSLSQWLELKTLCDLTREEIPPAVRGPLVDYLRLQGIDIDQNPGYKPDRFANDAHLFHRDALRKAADTHVEMQNSALSLNFDVAKSVRDGQIVVVLLPHPEDMDCAASTLVRALMRCIGAAVTENPTPTDKPFVTVLEGADGYLQDGDSGKFLETLKAANSPAFVVSELPIALPGLRGSAAIHVHQGIRRPLECVLVTDRERTEFVFPR